MSDKTKTKTKKRKTQFLGKPALTCLLTQLCPTPGTVARQAPLSKGFPRQEYWSELPFPSPGDLPNPGIKAMSPALQADSLPLSHQGKTHQSYLTSKTKLC